MNQREKICHQLWITGDYTLVDILAVSIALNVVSKQADDIGFIERYGTEITDVMKTWKEEGSC
jgi:hypothetical protein